MSKTGPGESASFLVVMRMLPFSFVIPEAPLALSNRSARHYNALRGDYGRASAQSQVHTTARRSLAVEKSMLQKSGDDVQTFLPDLISGHVNLGNKLIDEFRKGA